MVLEIAIVLGSLLCFALLYYYIRGCEKI